MSEWKELDYADAVVAHRGGGHEIQIFNHRNEWVSLLKGWHGFGEGASYRIRKKQTTITATIPLPMIGMELVPANVLVLHFADQAAKGLALDALCKAAREAS